MKTGRPRFSVVLPTHDRPDWLMAAAESVLDQTATSFDLWIVDDGSGAETKEVCATLHRDGRVRVLSNERALGAAAARNRGISAAEGEYIAFIDDDCTWHPERLDKVDARLRGRDPEPGYLATRTVMMSSGPPPRFHVDPVLPEGEPPWRVGAPMMVARRELLVEIGGFDERLPRSHDWDLALRLVDRADWEMLDEPLVWAEDLAGLTSDPSKILEASRVLLAKYGRHSPVSHRLTVHLHRAFAHKLMIRGHGPAGRRHYGRAATLAPLMLRNWATFALAAGGVRLYQSVTRFWERIAPGHLR